MFNANPSVWIALAALPTEYATWDAFTHHLEMAFIRSRRQVCGRKASSRCGSSH